MTGASLDQAVLRWFNDIAAHGIFTTDAALRIQGWNRWLELHTGRSAAEMIGQPLMGALPELETRGFAPYYAEALRGQVRVISQALHGHLLSMRGRLGNRTLSEMPQTGRIAPLTEDGRVVGTITIIEDVSERALREADLRSRIDDLDEAKRRADAAVLAKDHFLATLSHELRTPLNAVMGWTRILRKSGTDGPDAVRALDIIERNALSQVRLIDDLLDMSRILAGKLRIDVKPVDLVAVVNAAVDVSLPAASAKGIELRLKAVPRVPFVGDAERLQQVVWNLLSNAVKFTPEGGRVEVELTVEDDGAAAVIAVRDTGQGIDAAFLPLIFQRFRQADASTSRRHGGLGIGLALVRQLVELHGGTVRAESPGLGGGTTASVRFPLMGPRRDAQAVASAEAAVEAVGLLADVEILVVDDEPDTREMLRTLLSAEGAAVHVAGSCDDALDALAFPSTGRTQVILSDVAMPGEDGYALMARLRADARFREITAIALTAYALPEEHERALAAGFAGYLTKPIGLDALTATIRSLVDRAGRRGD